MHLSDSQHEGTLSKIFTHSHVVNKHPLLVETNQNLGKGHESLERCGMWCGQGFGLPESMCLDVLVFNAIS